MSGSAMVKCFLCNDGHLCPLLPCNLGCPVLRLGVYNKDGSSPLVDAKWWKDESGDIGAVGDAL